MSPTLPRFTLRLKNQTILKWNRPLIMGVINLSPNSFYQPVANLEQALFLAEAMVKGGAAILDVGGEATNPSVDLLRDKPELQIEIDRVVPVIEAIKQRFEVLVSVDTSEVEVMRASVKAGVDLVNDQRTLKNPGVLDFIIESELPVCLMHFFDPIRKPESGSKLELLEEIVEDFRLLVANYQQAGLASDRIILDPGFGGGHYGKSTDENYYLLKNLARFDELSCPVLIGWSRKSMLGDTLDAVSEDRLYGGIAAAVLAAINGAAIIRTHDVKATSDAMKVLEHYWRV